MRNIETFTSKHMYLYLSLVERKVAEFYHSIIIWLKWLIFFAFPRQFMVSLQLQIQIQIQSISIRTTSWPGKPWTLAVTGGLEENQRSLRFSIIHHVGTLRAVEILRDRGDSPGMEIFFNGSLSDHSPPISVPGWLAQSSVEIWRSQLYLHLEVVPKTCRSDPPAPKPQSWPEVVIK